MGKTRLAAKYPSCVRSHFCCEVPVSLCASERHPARIGALEVGDDFLVGHVRVVAPLPDVLHMPPASRIVFMEERIVQPVELQRIYTEPLAEAEIERGCRFDPVTVQIQFGETVPDEEITS